MSKLARLFSVSALTSLLTACSFVGGSSSPELTIEVRNAPREYMDVNLERESSTMHNYLKAELSLSEQNFEAALKYLERAASLSPNPETRLHAKLANLYVREGKLEKALQEVKLALELAPEDTELLFLYGGVLESLGREEESITVYRELINKYSDNFEAHVLLSSLYTKRKQYNKSIKLLTSFSKKHPHDPLPPYYIGHIYELAQNNKLAESFYLKSFKLQPRNTQVVRNLFRLYFKQNDLEKLKGFCKQVINRDPTNLTARRILSQIYLGSGRFDEALEQLQVLESVEREPSETRLKIAVVHVEQQNYTEALKELQLVLASYPKHSEALYYLATVYAGMGDKEKALDTVLKIDDTSKIYVRSRMFAAFLARQEDRHRDAERYVRKAYEKDPENDKVFAYLLLILRTAKNYDASVELLKERVKSRPKDDYLWFQYAVILEAMGSQAEALDKMEKVIEINDQNSDALNFVAYGLAEQKRDLDRATNLVQKALKIKPKDPFYLDTLGWVYFQKGEYQKALEILEIAAQGAPTDIVIVEHLADVLAKLNQADRAIKVYKQVLNISVDDQSDPEYLDAKKRITEKLEDLKKAFSSSDS